MGKYGFAISHVFGFGFGFFLSDRAYRTGPAIHPTPVKRCSFNCQLFQGCSHGKYIYLMVTQNLMRTHEGKQFNSEKNVLFVFAPGLSKCLILSIPKFTANLYCICICSILKQMQYRFVVNFGTHSTFQIT